jgi:hypothetical protein
MNNFEKIIKQGYFYTLFNDKCHILCRTDEFIVYKYYRTGRGWRYGAESMETFIIHTDSGRLHSAERKARK